MLCKKFWPSIFLNKSETVGKSCPGGLVNSLNRKCAACILEALFFEATRGNVMVSFVVVSF